MVVSLSTAITTALKDIKWGDLTISLAALEASIRDAWNKFATGVVRRSLARNLVLRYPSLKCLTCPN